MVQLNGDEGAVLLRRGGAAHRGQGDQGDPRRQRRRHPRAPRPTGPTSTSSTAAARACWGGTGESFDWELLRGHRSEVPAILAGGLQPGQRRRRDRGRAALRGRRRQRRRGRARAARTTPRWPPSSRPPSVALRRDRPGDGMSAVEERFGPYGGRYVPETLIAALDELTAAWAEAREDAEFMARLDAAAARLHRPPDAALPGRAPLRAGRLPGLPEARGPRPHRRPQDQQRRSARRCWPSGWASTRVIAETGAGQHGVATATACALLGLECVVYMGTEDIRRQAPNVERMQLLGAEVAPVEAGARTLKEAVSAAIRDWVANVGTTHYVIGSAVGPAPYPALVRDLQRVIGEEAREQALAAEGCAAGAGDRLRRRRLQRDRHLPPPSSTTPRSALIGVEAAGEGLDTLRHGASLGAGSTGVLHGSLSSVIADEEGQILEAHSISAGPRLPGRRARARPPARHGPRQLRRDHRSPGAGGFRRAGAAGGDHPGARVLPRDCLAAGEPGGEWLRRSLPLGTWRQGPSRGGRAHW